jgi:hypothetical protein
MLFLTRGDVDRLVLGLRASAQGEDHLAHHGGSTLYGLRPPDGGDPLQSDDTLGTRNSPRRQSRHDSFFSRDALAGLFSLLRVPRAPKLAHGSS